MTHTEQGRKCFFSEKTIIDKYSVLPQLYPIVLPLLVVEFFCQRYVYCCVICNIRCLCFPLFVACIV